MDAGRSRPWSATTPLRRALMVSSVGRVPALDPPPPVDPAPRRAVGPRSLRARNKSGHFHDTAHATLRLSLKRGHAGVVEPIRVEQAGVVTTLRLIGYWGRGR